jgi:hypothetical protein
MMPFQNILKNKLQLFKQIHISESDVNEWPFYVLEENIKLINEMNEEENKERKKQEDNQKTSMPNFNPSSYTKGLNGIGNKFKR